VATLLQSQISTSLTDERPVGLYAVTRRAPPRSACEMAGLPHSALLEPSRLRRRLIASITSHLLYEVKGS
jgi:hypothetical protein